MEDDGSETDYMAEFGSRSFPLCTQSKIGRRRFHITH